MSMLHDRWESEESPDIVLRVRQAQVQHLYKQTWSGLAGIMFIMVAVCAALWQIIPHWKLLAWSGALVLLSAARVYLLVAFKRAAPQGAEIDRWARLHLAGVVVSGVMWALPSIFLWPGNSPVHQLIWPICIVALASSAVAKYSIWTPAYISYLLLLMVPVSLRMLGEGGLVYAILGVLGFVFAAILAHTGRLMHNASLSALVTGVRNAALSAVLSDEIANKERLNAQLQQEIQERARSQDELRLRNRELESLNEQLSATKTSLEATNRELGSALLNIKQLSGLLPICAACKKIRNDKGYWEQIEGYIRDHSDAQFSHSICPDCAKKLYPGFYREK